MGEVLGARNPTTIRELLEAQIRLFNQVDAPMSGIDRAYQMAEHAVAAIDLTTEIENLIAAIRDAFDADYPSDPRANSIAALALLVPDPGVGAEHAPKEHP